MFKYIIATTSNFIRPLSFLHNYCFFIQFMQVATEIEEKIHRPLIKPYHHIQQRFLPLEYHYSLADITQIKKYIPATLDLVGIDKQFNEIERNFLKKEKINLKAVRGHSPKSNRPVKFYKSQELELVKLKEVYFCIDVPFNPQHPTTLQAKLSQYIYSNFFLRSKQTNQIYAPYCNEPAQPNQLDIYLQPTQIPPQPSDTHIKEIRFKIPIALLLKKERHTVASFRQILIGDLLDCLSIMLNIQCSIRVIQCSPTLILHSFVKEEGEEEAECKKLRLLLDLSKQQKGIQLQPKQFDAPKPKNESRYLILLVILITLTATYLYLKLSSQTSIQILQQ